MNTTFDGSKLVITQTATLPDFDVESELQSSSTNNMPENTYKSITNDEINRLVNKMFGYIFSNPNSTHQEVYDYVQNTTTADPLLSSETSVLGAEEVKIYNTGSDEDL